MNYKALKFPVIAILKEKHGQYISLSEKKMYDNIKKAIETKNGKDAFDVLVFRSDYEYEEIEFHHLDKFNEDD